MVPQISRLCPLPLLLPQLQSCIHAPSTDLPYSFLSTFSCVVPTGFDARSPSLLSEALPVWRSPPEHRLRLRCFAMSQLYHPAPDSSLAIQTKISVFSLSHSSKTVCTVTRQDLCWLRQCCTSLTPSHSFLSLLLGTEKHADSQMFDQGLIWAKTEVV